MQEKTENYLKSFSFCELQQCKNKTSNYAGVTWNKNMNKWKAQLVHQKQIYYGGYFDNEEHAAMKINLLCDKYEIDRKHSEINIELIQKVPNSFLVQIFYSIEKSVFRTTW